MPPKRWRSDPTRAGASTQVSPRSLPYTKWDEYTRARNEMLEASDTPWAPWFIVRSDDKRRARLNVIAHLLGRIPYKKLPREGNPFPKHRKVTKGLEPKVPLKYVPETY
jgi:polyphosphate kinase